MQPDVLLPCWAPPAYSFRCVSAAALWLQALQEKRLTSWRRGGRKVVIRALPCICSGTWGAEQKALVVNRPCLCVHRPPEPPLHAFSALLYACLESSRVDLARWQLSKEPAQVSGQLGDGALRSPGDRSLLAPELAAACSWGRRGLYPLPSAWPLVPPSQPCPCVRGRCLSCCITLSLSTLSTGSARPGFALISRAGKMPKLRASVTSSGKWACGYFLGL